MNYNADKTDKRHEATTICDIKYRKTMPMELIITCQTEGWVTELMGDWLQVIQNRRPRILLRM
jgi:hypothetical protein